MTIQYKNPIYNKAITLKEIISENGNTIPYEWYHKILRGSGKPDIKAITLLAELVKLHLNSKNNSREFQISYSCFKTKFNFSFRQTYNALVGLEERGLIKRKERPIEINGHYSGNYLHITLQVEKLLVHYPDTWIIQNSAKKNTTYQANYRVKDP